MRFKGLFEAWRIGMGVGLMVLFAFLLWPNAERMMNGEADMRDCVFVLVAGGAGLIAGIVMIHSQPILRNYAELCSDYLLVARGRKTYRVTYDQITDVRVQRDQVSHYGVHSTLQHVLVVYNDRKLYVSVEDEFGFITELKRRCPRISKG